MADAEKSDTGEPSQKKPRLNDAEYQELRNRLKARKKAFIVCVYFLTLEVA